jgi:hypothetical protein
MNTLTKREHKLIMNEFPERILCAAIWYDIEPDKDDKAIRYLYKDKIGLVISGHRHGHCMYLFNTIIEHLRPDLKFVGGSDNTEYNKVTGHHVHQGFLTSHNRFVDRKEAMIIAKNNEQVVRITGDDETLFSEDLY